MASTQKNKIKVARPRYPEYDAVQSYINDFVVNGGEWSLYNNCTDFVIGMLDAAGIAHESFGWPSDPANLATWLNILAE